MCFICEHLQSKVLIKPQFFDFYLDLLCELRLKAPTFGADFSEQSERA
jgi:hypothetical protein